MKLPNQSNAVERQPTPGAAVKKEVLTSSTAGDACRLQCANSASPSVCISLCPA